MAMGLVALLGACTQPPNSAYLDRGHPQSLLDVSSEVVSLSVAGKTDLDALSTWIAKDQPTRAELFCEEATPDCKSAKKILEAANVGVEVNPSPNNTVTLVYERILARDCSARYNDGYHSQYNAYTTSFGCAVSANMVQQVSDKRDFINPNLSDDPSARGAVSAYQRAYAPKQEEQQRYGVGEALTKSAGGG
jgi:hypothetical protein